MTRIASRLLAPWLSASMVMAALARPSEAQAAPRPQLHAIRNVRLTSAPDAPKLTLVLRDGRIAGILDAASDPPAGARVIEGQGFIALPAFIDAYTHAGCVTPQPAAEKDVAPKTSSDVWVDMREADRKGIEPAFRAADVFKLDAETEKRYRTSGFGCLASAPHGQLLSGASALATTRAAAPRDLFITPVLFDHAGFECTGPGYPGTLMGSIAQLRQFFLDARLHQELEHRHAQGKPGRRPSYDADLQSIVPVLDKKRRVVCEAESAAEIERWIKLGDDFGFEVAISGGREAWRRSAVLVQRKIPVFLTLDWGEEVDDPHAKDKKPEKGKPDKERKETAKPGSEKPESQPSTVPEKPAQEPPKSPAQEAPKSKEKPDSEPPKTSDKPVAETEKPQNKPAVEPGKAGDKPGTESGAKTEGTASEKAASEEERWKYEEPLRVREERRRLWEEKRDCALRLADAGVAFAFGSGKFSPKELVERVRTLVEKGLSADVALRALTSGSAALLGVQANLGKIETGFDATIAIWTQDPLTGKDARLAWLIVDGFPYEFDLKSNELKGKPDEGVDITGSWTFEFDNPDAKPATAELKMTKDGAVKGTIKYRNPADDSEMSGEFEGQVAGKKFKLTGKVKIRGFEAGVEIEGEIKGDDMTGTTTWKFSGGEDSRKFTGQRKPSREGEADELRDDSRGGNDPHDGGHR